MQERKVSGFVHSNERRLKAKTSETAHSQSKPQSRKMLVIEEPTIHLLDSPKQRGKLKNQSSRYLSREDNSANKMPHLGSKEGKLSKSQSRSKALTEEEKERGDRLINHLLSRTPLKNRLQEYETGKRYNRQEVSPPSDKQDDSTYFYAPLLKLIKEKAAVNPTALRPINSTHFSRRPEPTLSMEKRRLSHLPR